jgi:arabinosaccharide transport system substrate-binding protein
MEFPYGKASFAILVLALSAGTILLGVGVSEKVETKPDLILATFTPEHAAIYRETIPAFERENHVKIQLDLVDQRALQNRLEAALEAGAPVPDMVELIDATLGVFTKGPIEDVELTDLTQKLHDTGLYDRIVKSRFEKWSSRGHIYALPHDVHPAFLCYRSDLVKQLGIDVDTLTTWDEFARVGREITKSSTKDGVVQHYMIDLPADGGDAVRLMLLQRGGALLDKNGDAAFDSEQAAAVVLYYVRATEGAGRFSFPCGWGQPLSRAMLDGLCLFYICPDWRTLQFEMNVPELSGKLELMQLPAWEPGGLRTSTWGGTGLMFPKSCRNFDLAWKLAMYLYYDPKQLGPRFSHMNILPPLKDSWTMPQFREPRPFWCGQPIGEMFIEAAPLVPSETVNAYISDARDKFGEAYTSAADYYANHGEDGFEPFVRSELKRCANDVRRRIAHNVFLAKPTHVEAK